MSDVQTPIYLDHNATTPVLPAALEAMLPYLRKHFGNPSSGHLFGRRARRAVDRARGQVAALLGCSPSEIIFTSGGTEANNLAIVGVARARPSRRTIVSSVIEHPATARPCQWLADQGHTLHLLDVDHQGRIVTDQARQVIDDDTALVTVMHSNNETGVLQPIEELVELARERGAVVHTDAAQSVGKIPVKVDRLQVDLLSLAGHKLYAPKGIGALYVRRGTPLEPLLLGAGHEGGLRPGTENVASIVALGVACEHAAARTEEVSQKMSDLRDLLWTRLQAAIPDIALNGHPSLRLPNTLNVRFPGVTGDAILARAPEVAASTGSACAAGGPSASATILAMGVPAQQALGSLRLSLGRDSTEAEIEIAARALISAYREET